MYFLFVVFLADVEKKIQMLRANLTSSFTRGHPILIARDSLLQWFAEVIAVVLF